MTEWSGEDDWAEAKERSEDFRRYATPRRAREIMEEVTGSRSLYIKPGDTSHLSLWCAIAGSKKSLHKQLDSLSGCMDLNRERISNLEDRHNEIEQKDNGDLASEVAYLREKVAELEEKLEGQESKGQESGGQELEIEEERIEEPEKEIPKLDVQEIVEKRGNRRGILTAKQDKIYRYVLGNPGASKKDLQQASGMNWANTINSLMTILDKNFQLPVKFCNRFGLETEFSGENMVGTEESEDSDGNADGDDVVEA